MRLSHGAKGGALIEGKWGMFQEVLRGKGDGGEGGETLEARLMETYMDQNHGACSEADTIYK